MPGAVEQARRLENDFVLADALANARGPAEADLTLPSHEFEWKGRWFYATPHVLRDAIGAVAGMSMAWMDITDRKQAEQQRAEAHRRLQEYARQDYLTGLYNRRVLDEHLEREIARTRRDAQTLSVCMVDVDHFKAYNDHLGHLEGDVCLRAVAQALARHVVRPADLVSRYGGEEFVIVLPDTDEKGAERVAERLRAAVESLALPHAAAPLGVVTVSVGLVSCGPSRTAPAVPDLLRAADQALYRAKHAGRNRVSAGRYAIV